MLMMHFISISDEQAWVSGSVNNSLNVFRMDEQRYLSYNFKPHYVGRNDIGWLFEEAYLF